MCLLRFFFQILQRIGSLPFSLRGLCFIVLLMHDGVIPDEVLGNKGLNFEDPKFDEEISVVEDESPSKSKVKKISRVLEGDLSNEP